MAQVIEVRGNHKYEMEYSTELFHCSKDITGSIRLLAPSLRYVEYCKSFLRISRMEIEAVSALITFIILQSRLLIVPGDNVFVFSSDEKLIVLAHNFRTECDCCGLC